VTTQEVTEPYIAGKKKILRSLLTLKKRELCDDRDIFKKKQR